MKLHDIDMSKITLLHDSNLKFLEGRMSEPINDIEVLYNIEHQWQEKQPRLLTLIFEVVLGLLLLGITVAFWVNILAALVADLREYTSQPLAEFVGVLAVNGIILCLTGLLGWAGVYLLRFVVAQYRMTKEQLLPEDILHHLLSDGEIVIGQVLWFLNPEQTQVLLQVGSERYFYSLYQQSHLKAGDFILILQLEDYIGLL